MTSNLEELLHSKPGINITGKIYICDDECLFQFDNALESGSKIMNENDVITIEPSSSVASNITFNNTDYCPEYDEYMLKALFINGPSRHTLYGKRHDIGIELVYTTKDEKQIVMITVFGDVLDDKFNESYKFLEEISDKYFPQHLKSIDLPDSGLGSFNPIKLLPIKRTFFTYQRSHKVKQIVMENPIPVPHNFMQKFKKYVVPLQQYKVLMDKPVNKPGAKVIIYATVPPTIAEEVPIRNESDIVNVIEHFDTEVEPSDEQWGYWGVVAGITMCAILFIILILWGDGAEGIKFITSFIKLGVFKISMIVIASIFCTFILALIIESKIQSVTIGQRVSKFFIYLTWYIVLTFIIIGLIKLLGKAGEPTEPSKKGWFNDFIDRCPSPTELIGVEDSNTNVPSNTTVPSNTEVITWPRGEIPSLIGVQVPFS